MKEYKNVRSSARPQDIEITQNAVYIAKNITPYEETIDGRVVTGYEYDCEDYTKDEYLIHQNETITSLEEELKAAKILLGVD
jgi:hypothetical protein